MAKGIGIVLVVAGHVMGGLIDSTVPLGGLPLREIFLSIYVFHMPLFFVLSGLFVGQRIKKDPHSFKASIFRSLYFPYLLWSFIQFNVIFAIGSLANTPPQAYFSEVLWIPLFPVSQFWFLLVLCTMHILTVILLPRVGAVGMLVIGMAMQPMAAIIDAHWMLIQGLFGFYVYYAVGALLTPQGVEQLLRARDRARLIVGTIVALEILAMTVLTTMDHLTAAAFYRENPRLPAATIAASAWMLLCTAAALAMTAMVLAWSIVARGRIKAALLSLGKASMPIYILHVLFAAGTRIVLVRLFGIENIFILLPLVMLAGMVGPLIAFATLDRLRLARPLGFA